MRYGRFEGHMCERHADYLAWLWSSSDVSCLSSIGLPLRPARNDPPSDQVRALAGCSCRIRGAERSSSGSQQGVLGCSCSELRRIF